MSVKRYLKYYFYKSFPKLHYEICSLRKIVSLTKCIFQYDECEFGVVEEWLTLLALNQEIAGSNPVSLK